MPRRTIAAVFTAAACCMAGAANAEPVKIALIETLSGGQAVTGKLFQSAMKYGLAKLEAEKAWPDGIKLLEYDNQGGPSEAADKVKAAINDGAHIIIQGASSAIGGQITADVQKHNARNPGKEIMYINVGAEAMEFTGAEVPLLPLPLERQRRDPPQGDADRHEGGQCARHKVYVIGQNYSWGHDVQKLASDYAKSCDYTVVGDVIHDVNKIQDFAPYVAKIKEAEPDTVITGNWSQRSAAADEGRGRSGPQGALRRLLDRPAGQHRQRRRHGDRPLQRVELLSRGQRRGDGERSPTTSRPRPGSIRCSSRATRCTASGDSARR